MRQQDYRMVQGVNQVVNMNPNIAAQGGAAMARLGRQLAQTGQDVSAMMEETAKADDETKLMRMEQRWKEAHNKQLIFQEENPNDPLDWQTHRAKMLPNIEAENNAVKFNTKWGRKSGSMAYEMWKSNTGMEVDRMSHGKIFRNRIDVGLSTIKNSLEDYDMVGAQKAYGVIKDDLHPSVAERVEQSIQDKGEEFIWNGAVDNIDADGARALREYEEGTGYAFTHYRGDKGREDREKYYKLAKTARKQQAIEQMDALELARLENPSFGTKDLQKMIKRDELNQLTPLEIAKVSTAMARTEPPTGAEIVSIHGIMDDLAKSKKTMPRDQYIKLYHNASLMIRSMIPNTGYGYIFSDLKALNPNAKEGLTGSAESKRSNRTEVTALTNAALKMGKFDYRAGDKDGRYKKDRYGNREYDSSRLEPSQLDIQGRNMRDVQEKLLNWIEASDKPLTNEDVRQQFGIIMAGGAIISALEMRDLPFNALGIQEAWQPSRVQNQNTWSDQMPNQQTPASTRPEPTGEYKKEEPKPMELPTATGSVDRSIIMDEVESDPDTKRLLYASTYAEVGSQGDEAIQAYMETVTNRALATGKSLRQILSDPRYYPEATKRKLSNKNAPNYDDEWLLVSHGSNIANYATDNASSGLARNRKKAGNPYVEIGGELFYVNINGNGEGGIPAHKAWLKKHTL